MDDLTIMLSDQIPRTRALLAALLATALVSPISRAETAIDSRTVVADAINPSNAMSDSPPASKANMLVGLFGPSNFWECVLDKMPGSQNELAAQLAAHHCAQKFPGGAAHQVAPSDKVGYWLGTPTAKDCFTKHGKTVASEWASRVIYAACHQLYVD